jgi:hypothetical protein
VLTRRSRPLGKAAGCPRSAAPKRTACASRRGIQPTTGAPGRQCHRRLVHRRRRGRRGRAAPPAGRLLFCGQVVGAVHDRSLRRWRHLDLAGQRLFLEYALRRIVAPTAASASRRCPSPILALATRATSRTSRPSSASSWPRRRSRRCFGSAGTRWARSSSASSATTSTSDGCTGSSRSAGRGLLPPRPALPHLRRRPQLELDRLVAHGPLGRDLAGLLRRALRAQGVDPCGLDRHVGGL